AAPRGARGRDGNSRMGGLRVGRAPGGGSGPGGGHTQLSNSRTRGGRGIGHGRRMGAAAGLIAPAVPIVLTVVEGGAHVGPSGRQGTGDFGRTRRMWKDFGVTEEFR